MKIEIFAIHDSKAEAYMQPFFTQATGVAIREFTKLSNDETHPIGQNPTDYTLFYLGTWDQWTGDIKGDIPKAVVNGKDVQDKIQIPQQAN